MIYLEIQWYFVDITWYFVEIQWYFVEFQWYSVDIQWYFVDIQWYFFDIQWYSRMILLTEWYSECHRMIYRMIYLQNDITNDIEWYCWMIYMIFLSKHQNQKTLHTQLNIMTYCLSECIPWTKDMHTWINTNNVFEAVTQAFGLLWE